MPFKIGPIQLGNVGQFKKRTSPVFRIASLFTLKNIRQMLVSKFYSFLNFFHGSVDFSVSQVMHTNCGFNVQPSLICFT